MYFSYSGSAPRELDGKVGAESVAGALQGRGGLMFPPGENPPRVDTLVLEKQTDGAQVYSASGGFRFT